MNDFPANWRLRKEERISILMPCHYPNPGSVTDWLKIYFNQLEVLFAVGNLWIILLSYLAQELLSSNDIELTHCMYIMRNCTSTKGNIWKTWDSTYLLLPNYFALVLGRFSCLDDPESYTTWVRVPGRFKHAGHVWVKGQMNCNAWLARLTTRRLVNVTSPEKDSLTKTRHIFQDNRGVEVWRHCT